MQFSGLGPAFLFYLMLFCLTSAVVDSYSVSLGSIRVCLFFHLFTIIFLIAQTLGIFRFIFLFMLCAARFLGLCFSLLLASFVCILSVNVALVL